MPGGFYKIDVIDEACSVEDDAAYSLSLDLPTARWGDTVKDLSSDPAEPPDGSVDIIDCMAIVARFQSEPTAISKTRAELEPGCPDLVINITDVMQCVNAFQGLLYPFEPTALDPCDSLCVNPLPG